MNIKYDDALNNAAWTLLEGIQDYQKVEGHLFKTLLSVLKEPIEVYLTHTFEEKTK